MSEATTILGKTHTGQLTRDAIHIAVASCHSEEAMRPGEHVGLASNDNKALVTTRAQKLIGIVDPFYPRKELILPGTWFWVCLYPQTITDLRHVWTHPVFGAPGLEFGGTSYDWMVKWAGTYGFTAEKAIHKAKNYLLYGEYWVDEGTFEGEHFPKEFWTHYEAITGETVPDDKKQGFLSCSC